MGWEYQERFPPQPRFSNPDMHHGTCVTRVPWYMSGSLTIGFLWNRVRGKRKRPMGTYYWPIKTRIHGVISTISLTSTGIVITNKKRIAGYVYGINMDNGRKITEPPPPPHTHTHNTHTHFSKLTYQLSFNTLRPRQNGRYFADDTYKHIFLHENVRITIEISLKFVPKSPIDNILALFQIMAWRRPGDKPLSGAMMISILTHICVARPRWVKDIELNWTIIQEASRLSTQSWEFLRRRQRFLISFCPPVSLY